MPIPISLNNKQYNGQLYASGPLSLRDVTTNRAEMVHQELYDAALNDLMKDLQNYIYDKDNERYSKAPFHFVGEVNEKLGLTELEDRKKISNYFDEEYIYNIVEMNADEYWLASSVYIIFRIFNVSRNTFIFVKKSYDLSPYWAPYLSKHEKKTINVKVSQENLSDVRITKYDYIRGKATMTSKINEIDYDVDFDLLSNNDYVDNDILLPDNMFTQIITI